MMHTSMTPALGVGEKLLNTWSMSVLVPVGENRVGDEIKDSSPKPRKQSLYAMVLLLSVSIRLMLISPTKTTCLFSAVIMSSTAAKLCRKCGIDEDGER